MSRFSFKNIQILRLFRGWMVFCGIFFTICILISFTSLPYWGVYWLGTGLPVQPLKPEFIVFLGGSGMPSESNLIRSWYTASFAVEHPDSKVVIVMPGEITDSLSTPRKMERELIVRGIGGKRIILETSGTNTRSQALACARVLDLSSPVCLVTSPENMRRTILCFRKAGFLRISALPAFENAAEADFRFNDDELGRNPVMVPDVGKSLQLRYQFWNHLKYEIMLAREMTALAYYKIRGWI